MKSDPAETRLSVAIQARTLEIELFWKRSFFFWGFIASAFVGYGVMIDKAPSVTVVVAGFGFVCSVAWTLANRGSKFWQENWETKVERAEQETIGDVFRTQESRQAKGWFSAHRYSVSRLVIALSDYSIFAWAVLEVHATQRAIGLTNIASHYKTAFVLTYVIATLAYTIFVLFTCRSQRETPYS